MAGKSSIEWTEHTWNPIVGCSILTPGCTNCYAMSMAARIEAMNKALPGSPVGQQYDGTTKRVNGHPVWTGKIALAPDSILLAPMRRKKPTTYFVNSMGDLFHEAAPDEWIDRVFAVMALSPQHTFQVLTKRAERMRAYFTASHPAPNVDAWHARVCSTIDEIVPQRTAQSVNAKINIAKLAPLPNVWLGVSAERQQEWDERSEHLWDTPAAVRFVSCEPLLGPIRFHPCRYCNHPGNVLWPCPSCKGRRFEIPDWVIVGGESGSNSRPMHPEWARSLRDQCAAAGVPFFFKQWGEFGRVGDQQPPPDHLAEDADTMTRVGKARAGRTLDSNLHSDMPRGRG